MRRREFVKMAGGSAAAWPLLAGSVFAQESGRSYRVGFLTGNPRTAPQVVALFDELRTFGFSEGQNLQVLPGSFEVRNDEMGQRATAFVKSSADAIFCSGEPAARLMRGASETIPVVVLGVDIVGSGLVKSLARPGGFTTGISILAFELDGKRQDLLIEAVPGLRRMAVLSDPTITPPSHVQMLQDAARGRGIKAEAFSASTPDAIAPAMDAAKAAGAEAVNVLAAPLFNFNRRALILQATGLRLPAIYEWPDMAEDGGLLGYGPRLSVIYRQAARQIVKVLRGVKPGDIPVEQPTTFELVVNLQAAKAIGYEVPAGLVLRADKVIE